MREIPTIPVDLPKERRRFHIIAFSGKWMGYGDYYPYGGNIQVYLERDNYAAKQLNMLGEIMLFENVMSIAWIKNYPAEQRFLKREEK